MTRLTKWRFMTDRQDPRTRAADQPDRNASQRGTALIEAAMVLPLILMLVLGVVDYGFMINRDTLINNAAREGAREAAFGGDAAAIEARVRDVAWNLDQTDLTVTVTCTKADGSACPGVSYDSEWEPGGSVIVTVQYTYHLITPLTGLLGIGPDEQLQSDITMRIEG